jgi:hypothetical protein
MDLTKAIRELHEELNEVNVVIAALEQFEITGDLPPAPRRGRKSMAAQERKAVSARMKRYWARNRKSAHVRDGASSSGTIA